YHRESYCIRERLEELALDALQREDGHEDGDDDEDGEGHRPPDLLRGDEDGLAHRVLAVLFEVAVDVLDHHDRRVDHHPDADGEPTKRGEVGGDAHIPHQDKGDHHAERDRGGGDERTAEVSEQQEENQKHQRLALDERLDYRVDAVIDQLRLIVVIDYMDALGERPVDLGHLVFDSFDDLLGVLIDALEHDAGHDFALPVLRDRALSYLAADLDRRHVRDPDGRAAARVEHDVLDV